MPKIRFIYMNNTYESFFEKDSLIIDAIRKYMENINKNIEDFYFTYKGKKIKINNRHKIKEYNCNNNIIISIFYLKPDKRNHELENIICPECKNLALLNINDDKISIENCINNHLITDISINNFMDSQIINELDIKCNICNNNKYYYKEEFYICSCGNYICGLCIKKHKNNGHNLLNYNHIYCNPCGYYVKL